MYSPKIAEDLIPKLYWLAKGRKIPMTRLVDEIIRKVICVSSERQPTADTHACMFVREPTPRDAA